jgi:hypothetical protein
MVLNFKILYVTVSDINFLFQKCVLFTPFIECSDCQSNTCEMGYRRNYKTELCEGNYELILHCVLVYLKLQKSKKEF